MSWYYNMFDIEVIRIMKKNLIKTVLRHLALYPFIKFMDFFKILIH